VPGQTNSRHRQKGRTAAQGVIGFIRTGSSFVRVAQVQRCSMARKTIFAVLLVVLVASECLAHAGVLCIGTKRLKV
jgi:hypothetical protein